MEDEKTAAQELKAWMKDAYHNFIDFLKPNPQNHWSIQLIKSILKIPLVLISIVLSPILLVVLIVVFVLVL